MNEKICNILLGALAGFLLALGFSRACDKLTGNKAYRYIGSGSPSRRAEDRLWESAGDHIDRALGILSGSRGGREGE